MGGAGVYRSFYCNLGRIVAQCRGASNQWSTSEDSQMNPKELATSSKH